jgi:hypothetical protein
MPKLIDVLKTFSDQIESEELKAAFSATDPNEVEITDEGFEAIKTQVGGFMTFERAVNDKKVLDELVHRVNNQMDSKVHKDMRSMMLASVERKMADFGDLIDVPLKDLTAYDQIEALKAHAERLKAPPADTTKTKEIENLHLQLKAKDEDLVKIQTGFKQELENTKISNFLDHTISGYKLAKPYQDAIVKKGIENSIKELVTSKVTLKIGEDNTVGLFQKDTPDLKYFDANNKEIGINELIDPMIQPYLQVTDQDKKIIVPETSVPQMLINPDTQVAQLKNAALI